MNVFCVHYFYSFSSYFHLFCLTGKWWKLTRKHAYAYKISKNDFYANFLILAINNNQYRKHCKKSWLIIMFSHYRKCVNVFSFTKSFWWFFALENMILVKISHYIIQSLTIIRIFAIETICNSHIVRNLYLINKWKCYTLLTLNSKWAFQANLNASLYD